MYFERKLLKQLKKQLSASEILVVTGMRRTGKTTLCQMLLDYIKSPNKVFIDMENPISQKLFEELDYANILQNLRKVYGIDPSKPLFVFLDEIQSMPQAVKAVKYLFDHFKIKFVLTGSSSFYLKNLMPESLAGRKYLFELSPLDFEEFLWFKGQKPVFESDLQRAEAGKSEVGYERLKAFYEEYLEYGGFPGVVLEDDLESKKMRLDDIFKSYFEKDVQVVGDFRDISVFRDLLLLLMQRVASKIDLGKLGREVGIDRRTVNKYLKFLESTYFIHLAAPYNSRNRDSEIRGAKKIYLCDTGFLNKFAKVDRGCIFENAVYISVRKYGKVCYYQTKSGGEVDFIIPEKNMAFEAKYSGAGFDYKRLNRLPKGLGMNNFYIVTHDFDSRSGFIPALGI